MRHFAAFLFLLLAGAQGADLPWKTPFYTLRAQDTPVAQLLRDFCSIQGIPVVIDEKVQGDVSGLFDQIQPDVFLDQMCKANGLTWFFDGHTLYVNREEEVKSEMMPMTPTAAGRVNGLLAQMGARARHMEVRAMQDQGMALVSGPPRFFELIRTFSIKSEERKDLTEVQVFPLKYAWAYDLSFNFRDEQVTVPGVATVLQNINAKGETARAASSSGASAIHSSTQPRLKGKGLIQQSTTSASKRATNVTVNNIDSGSTGSSGATSPASPIGGGGGNITSGPASQNGSDQQIYADVRLNAVIIRDTRENLDAMAKIIQILDAPTSLIEISAAIVDVNSDNSRTLGTEFFIPSDPQATGTGSGGAGGGALNQPNNAFNLGNVGNNAASATSLLSKSLPVDASSLIVTSGSQFLTSIRAMEDAGKGKILSRPSVLTLDNVEATLRNDDTIYVRVAGQEEVDLFNVTAGVSLQVTPHVIEGKDGRRIKLVLNIEDGTFTQERVDAVPTVRKSNINTQATLLEGQSLLIGGYTTERLTKQKRQVPLLGNLPGVGYLFKRETREKHKMQRLFLISPRVVNLTYGEKADVTTLFGDPYGAQFDAAAVDALATPLAKDARSAPPFRAANLPAAPSAPLIPVAEANVALKPAKPTPRQPRAELR